MVLMQRKSKKKAPSTGRKIAVGAGIVSVSVAAATAASYLLTRSLVKVALDREAPKSSVKSKKKISGSSKSGVYYEQRAAAAEKLQNSACETVEIRSRDGIKLIGHWHTCAHPKRVIIAMHGWRSSWADDFGLIADFLLNHGCNILFAEQRGQNQSGGDYIGFGLLERYDCADWAAWVQERCPLPIYLSGISMGAATVLMASGLPLPENVRGIVADCGYTSPHAIWEHVATDNLHLSYSEARRKTIDAICEQRLKGESANYSCEDALKECKVH